MTPPSATGQARNRSRDRDLELLRGFLAEQAFAELMRVSPPIIGNETATADFLEHVVRELKFSENSLAGAQAALREGTLMPVDLLRLQLDVMRACSQIERVVTNIRGSRPRGQPPTPLNVKELTAFLLGAAWEAGLPVYGNAATLAKKNTCTLVAEALSESLEDLEKYGGLEGGKDTYESLRKQVPITRNALGRILRECRKKDDQPDETRERLKRSYKLGRWAWARRDNRWRNGFVK